MEYAFLISLKTPPINLGIYVELKLNVTLDSGISEL